MPVALVTGCSSGLGMSTALALARRGVKVYASVREVARAGALAEKAAKDSLSVQVLELDVTDSTSIRHAVATVIDEDGAIDILVNNAGIGVPGAFEQISEDAFRRVMETNLYGPFRLTRAVLPGMRARRAGIVIMISSLSGLVGLPVDSAYCASKFALEGMTESLRYEVRRFNVRVVLIEPGAFRTAMTRKLAAAAGEAGESPYRKLMAFHTARLARSANHGDDAEVVAHLVAEVAFNEAPALRIPAGRQAEDVTEALRRMTEQERTRMILDVTGMQWWDEGLDDPG